MPKRDEQYDQYMREVQSYLKQVKGGRRVPAVDPAHPRYSQAADDERMAKKAGLGGHIQYGPPSPAWERVAAPPPMSASEIALATAPPTGGMNSGNTWYNRLGFGEMVGNAQRGLGYDKNWNELPGQQTNQNAPGLSIDRLDQFRGQLGKMFSSRGGAAPTPVWGFHEPTVTAGAGVEAGMEGAGKVLADPRNAWMGLGPLAAAGRGARLLRSVPDSGGFNVPTSQMLKQDTGMANLPDLWEQEKRNDYMFGRKIQNDLATTMRNGPAGPNREAFMEANDRFNGLDASSRVDTMRTIHGQQELKDWMENAQNPKLGGSVPNRYLFGR